MVRIGKIAAAAAVAATWAVAAPAQAVVTSTQVTTPAAGPTYLDPDVDGSGELITVSGTTDSTATGTDKLDVYCVTNDGSEDTVGPLNFGTPVDIAVDKSFTTQIDVVNLHHFLCRLVAVPDGATPPFILASFQGPVVSVGGFSLAKISSGPNAGKLYDYLQESSALEGYWSVNSAGNCFVADSFPLVPATLDYQEQLFGCSRLRQNQSVPAGKELQVDGQMALLPDKQTSPDPNRQGLQAISALTHSIVPGTGNMAVSDSEPAAFCVPDRVSCTSFADTGIRLDQSQTGGTLGHTLAIEHEWVNIGATTKQLHAAYEIGMPTATPGWKFPDDTMYATYMQSQTITPPAGGTDSFFVARAVPAPCSGVTDPCGSVTWSAPPQDIFFTSPDKVLLSYDRTLGPGCTARIGLTYSQGFPQGSVDGYAAAAEAALAGEPSVTCPPAAPSGASTPSQPAAAATQTKKRCKKRKKKRAAAAKKKKCKKK